MSDYYKLEQDVARMRHLLEALKKQVETLDGRVSVLEKARRKRGRGHYRQSEAREVINSCLEEMDRKGIADFSGMQTSDASMVVLTIAKVAGIQLDMDRGTRSIITRAIRERYGFELENNRFVKSESGLSE